MNFNHPEDLLRAAFALGDAWPEPASRDKHLARLRRSSNASLDITASDVTPPHFADGSELEAQCVRNLLSRLRREGPGTLSKTPRVVAHLLDDDSADAFSRSVLDAWRRHRDPDSKWAIYQLSIFARDHIFDDVGPGLDELASSGHHHEAGWWIETMARHGSARSHSWVYHWALSASADSLRRHARATVTAICKARDERLRAFFKRIDPFVYDRALDLKLGDKDTRGQQDIAETSRRLEDAMVGRREWSWSELITLLGSDCRLAESCANLVFATPNLTFSIVPDSLEAIDIHRNAVDPPDGSIRLVHPLDLELAELYTWKALADRHDAPAPFAQFNRSVIELALIGNGVGPRPDKPRRYLNVTIEVAGLRHIFASTPWRAGAAQDAGLVENAYRPFRGHALTVRLNHSPYYVAGKPEKAIKLNYFSIEQYPDVLVPIESVAPIVASELAYDLSRLTRTTS